MRSKILWIPFFILLLTGCTSCGGQNNNSFPPPPSDSIPSFDRARAFSFLVQQCEFGPRVPGSQAHAECLQWLVAQLSGADQLIRQNFRAQTCFGGPYDFTNVLALFGKDKPGVPFLLCAHWDCRPQADEDPDPAKRTLPVMGANDGASGVAVLLEIVQAFKASVPPRPIIIAFLDAEDSGRSGSDLPYQGFCLGSQYLAAHWPSELPKPAEGVLLDLVGGDDQPNPRLPPRFGGNDILDFPMELHSLQANRPLVERIWTIAQRRGHRAFIWQQGRAIIDDHVPLIAAGIRVINIIDFPPPEWHTADDTPEHCSPEALYQAGDTLLQFIYGK